MKTTMMFRSIANPRRTTLAGLADADAPQSDAEVKARAADEEAAGRDEESQELPASTANPRRTTVVDTPAS
jgi:hypothetical protein